MPGELGLKQSTVEDWPENKAKAAGLLAVGRLSVIAVAEEVGVVRETLWLWRQDTRFAAEVKRQRQEIHAEVWGLIRAEREGRVRELDEAADKIKAQWLATGSVVHYREYRETLKQIAIELGQWQPKQDVRLSVEERPVQIREVVYGGIEERIAKEERTIQQEVAEGTFVPIGSLDGETVEGEWRDAPVLSKPTKHSTKPQGQGDTGDDGWIQGTR